LFERRPIAVALITTLVLLIAIVADVMIAESLS
jgi:hypothetical protein